MLNRSSRWPPKYVPFRWIVWNVAKVKSFDSPTSYFVNVLVSGSNSSSSAPWPQGVHEDR